MKKKSLIALAIFTFTQISAQNNPSYLKYIEEYAALAVNEQKEHKIPASITLAQGLLESGAGNSELARKSNNHFGIKCGSDWKGPSVSYDDDKRGECFRKYSHPSQSFHDHSIFLKKERYNKLFSLRVTDYKGWAHGLKKAGYATDPKYAYKLIGIIEDYKLYKYDDSSNKGKSSGWTFGGNKHKKNDNSETKEEDKKASNVIIKKRTEKQKKSSLGAVAAYYAHQVYLNNRVQYVKSKVGDTYASIAEEFGLSEKEILQYNDLARTKQLAENEIVYLSWKRNKSRRTYHIVQDQDSGHSIAQKYGIKLSKLYDMNDIPYTEGVKPNQKLRLR